MIKKLKVNKLYKLALMLVNALLFLEIIRKCSLVGFCCTIINLISPLFFGFALAWLLKPIMLKLNKKLNLTISAALTYAIFLIIASFLIYILVPIIINEIKNMVPSLINLYHKLPPKIIDKINISEVGKKALIVLNNYASNVKTIILNIFYSIFISYYFLLSHKKVSSFLAKYIPSSLLKEISSDLRIFVKGTLLDTLILFIMAIISLYLVKMPYAFLFALIISLTNVIPFIGPYIGAVPTIFVALSVNTSLAITVLVIVIILQFIESNFIHPYIMSKTLKINPIIIIIGLIVFGHFFGIIGMLISTPLVSIIKRLSSYFIKKAQNK